MSRARHHTMKSKIGGKGRKPLSTGGEAGGNPNVFAEADKPTIGTIHGSPSKNRLDRKCGGRATGGKAGSDTSPYTSAHKSGGKAGC